MRIIVALARFTPTYFAVVGLFTVEVVEIIVVLRSPVDDGTLVRGLRGERLVQLVEFPLSQRLFELRTGRSGLLLRKHGVDDNSVVPAFV